MAVHTREHRDGLGSTELGFHQLHGNDAVPGLGPGQLARPRRQGRQGFICARYTLTP